MSSSLLLDVSGQVTDAMGVLDLLDVEAQVQVQRDRRADLIRLVTAVSQENGRSHSAQAIAQATDRWLAHHPAPLAPKLPWGLRLKAALAKYRASLSTGLSYLGLFLLSVAVIGGLVYGVILFGKRYDTARRESHSTAEYIQEQLFAINQYFSHANARLYKGASAGDVVEQARDLAHGQNLGTFIGARGVLQVTVNFTPADCQYLQDHGDTIFRPVSVNGTPVVEGALHCPLDDNTVVIEGEVPTP